MEDAFFSQLDGNGVRELVCAPSCGGGAVRSERYAAYRSGAATRQQQLSGLAPDGGAGSRS